jgi:hypothetical protein
MFHNPHNPIECLSMSFAFLDSLRLLPVTLFEASREIDECRAQERNIDGMAGTAHATTATTEPRAKHPFPDF